MVLSYETPSQNLPLMGTDQFVTSRRHTTRSFNVLLYI